MTMDKKTLQVILDVAQKSVVECVDDEPSKLLQTEALKANYEYVSEELRKAKKKIKELEAQLSGRTVDNG